MSKEEQAIRNLIDDLEATKAETDPRDSHATTRLAIEINALNVAILAVRSVQ